jgi:hypothetical protein
MGKRAKRKLRYLEERMDLLEHNDHTLSIRTGHLAQHRHEHWAKIRELDIRVSALEGNPPSDWNYGTRWVRVGGGPKPSERSMRKAAKRVADAVRAVRNTLWQTAEERARMDADIDALLKRYRLRDANPADTAAAAKVADELFGKEPVITFGPDRDEAVTNPVVEAVARENLEDLRQALRRETAEETRREMDEAPDD